MRPLAQTDLDAVTAIDQACFPPGISYSRAMFEECLSFPEFQGWGVTEGDRLVAFAIIFWAGPRVAQIITIDVLPEFRRRGIGDALMSEIESAALRRDLRRLVLQVDVENKSAIPLYQKWGYRIKSLLPDYYGPDRDAFMMDKQLSVTAPLPRPRVGAPLRSG